MQQVQHHAAQQQGDSNGAAAVVSQLAAIAKQQDEQFKAEQEMRKLKEEEERGLQMMDVKREDDLFGDVEMDGYNSSYAGSKRDISQVDSPEEPLRPAPSFVVVTLLPMRSVSASSVFILLSYYILSDVCGLWTNGVTGWVINGKHPARRRRRR